MFEVGDRVVCVNAGSLYPFMHAYFWWDDNSSACGLESGKVYTVSNRATYVPTGEIFGVAVYEHGPVLVRSERFRKLRDISQSLAELKALTVNCPPLVETRS